MENLNIGNPIVFGLIGGVITYLFLYLDINHENKKISLSKKTEGKCYCPKLILSLKVPLIIGIIIWAAANYFESINKKVVSNELSNLTSFLSDSYSEFDQELFTDKPNF